MNVFGMIRVKCKHYNWKDGCDLDDNDDGLYFDCDDDDIFLSCSETSIITWTKFLIYRQHLIEVKNNE